LRSAPAAEDFFGRDRAEIDGLLTHGTSEQRTRRFMKTASVLVRLAMRNCAAGADDTPLRI
jgi:hypothetical protein